MPNEEHSHPILKKQSLMVLVALALINSYTLNLDKKRQKSLNPIMSPQKGIQ